MCTYIFLLLTYKALLIADSTSSELGSESKAYPYTASDDFEDVKPEDLYKYMWGLCLSSAPSGDNISLPGGTPGGSIITQSVLQDDTKCEFIKNIKPLVTNGLSHPYHLDESIFIFRSIWSIFISFFNENNVSKQNSPRWEAAFCGVTSGAILFAYVP